jgi:hypothetical protein
MFGVRPMSILHFLFSVEWDGMRDVTIISEIFWDKKENGNGKKKIR